MGNGKRRKKKLEALQRKEKKQEKIKFITHEIVCITVSLICIGLIFLESSIYKNIINNYDYSTIKELEGTVTDVNDENKSEHRGYRSGWYIEVELSDRNVSAYAGAYEDANVYSIGDQIKIYTDSNEKIYAISAQKVADDSLNASTIMLVVSCIIILITAFTWLYSEKFNCLKASISLIIMWLIAINILN
jgi:hypothetical protein